MIFFYIILNIFIHFTLSAIEIYTLFSANMLGLITDVGFHRNGQNDETAGLALTKLVKARTPHLPILVQSSEKSNEVEAVRLGASFLLKSDRHLLSGLREFMETSLGFGPFQFRDDEGALIKYGSSSPFSPPFFPTLSLS